MLNTLWLKLRFDGLPLDELASTKHAFFWIERNIEKVTNMLRAQNIARIYLFDDTGLCTVIANGPNFEVLAKNSIEELVQTTPAIADNSLYVRSEKHLWRISN